MKMRIEVTNVQEVYPARKASILVQGQGVVVGAAEDADWVIQDNSNGISDHHFAIEVADGKFVLKPFPKSKVYLNGSKSAVSARRKVLINDGDEISFGNLKSKVRTKIGMSDLNDEQFASEIMNDDDDQDDHMLIDGELVHAEERPMKTVKAPDPLDGFEDLPNEIAEDPVDLIDEERQIKKSEKGNNNMKPSDDDVIIVQDPDYSDKQVAALDNRKAVYDDYGFESDTKVDHSHDYYYSDPQLEGDVDQETLRMLALSLGVPFHDLLPEDAPVALADIGNSLQEAVRGIHHIFQSRQGNAHRFPLASMHIHAIEDNPLKFSKTHSEALDAMFVNRGQVHLSAPFAVKESLRHIDQHQQATEEAIDKGLAAIMRALHPKALEKRFSQYSRGRVPQEGPERDAWKWRMFEAYVSEMTSHRQTGLKMLFWEVFGNAYQERMRELDFGIEEASE